MADSAGFIKSNNSQENYHKTKSILSFLKIFWQFLKKDTWQSMVVSLILAFIIIKFIFFPLMSLVTGTPLPLVIVESCSMYHSEDLENIMGNPIYQNYNLTLFNSLLWPFKSGLNKGDIIFVISPKKIKVGDVIIFNGNQKNPIIHRIISISNNTITTKGDHNSGLLFVEQNFDKSQVLGKAIFKIPAIGWLKLIFFEASRSPEEKGFCK